MSYSSWGGELKAHLVYDQGEEVSIPPWMGTPREDQMQGTTHERLIELAGRQCYDSMGTGRSSAEYHKHIQTVKHFSIYEHATFTLLVKFMDGGASFLNRPDLWVEFGRAYFSSPMDDKYHTYRVTLNHRHAIEWWEWTNKNYTDIELDYDSPIQQLDGGIKTAGGVLAPSLYPRKDNNFPAFELAMPETDEEKWISIGIVCSRGCSHELVRHGNYSAISQRSTRFCDESTSNWVPHPLLAEALHCENEYSDSSTLPLAELLHDFKSNARYLYGRADALVRAHLQKKHPEITPDARKKQARGAARGILANALETELLFSASVAQWKRMIAMRNSPFADAEIKDLFGSCIIPALKSSRYGSSFA